MQQSGAIVEQIKERYMLVMSNMYRSLFFMTFYDLRLVIKRGDNMTVFATLTVVILSQRKSNLPLTPRRIRVSYLLKCEELP